MCSKLDQYITGFGWALVATSGIALINTSLPNNNKYNNTHQPRTMTHNNNNQRRKPTQSNFNWAAAIGVCTVQYIS